jgi:hypothetical protein
MMRGIWVYAWFKSGPGCPSFTRIQQVLIASVLTASPGTSSRKGTSAYLLSVAVHASVTKNP